MEQEQKKQKSILLPLLVIIIILLMVILILLVTGTLNIQSNDSDYDSNSNKAVMISDDATEDSEIEPDWIGQYQGKDPWGEDLIITLFSIDGDTLEWNISHTYYEQDLSSKINDQTTTFQIQGTSKDKQNTYKYSGNILIKEDSLVVTYESGQITSISSTGGSGFMMVDRLEESAKTVTLKKY